MEILKEFTLPDGRIVRVAKTNNENLNRKNIIVRICDIKYVNKTIDDDTIKKFYVGYVNHVNERNKTWKGKSIEVVSYNKYKQILINDYKLKGIPYKINDDPKLLEEL